MAMKISSIPPTRMSKPKPILITSRVIHAVGGVYSNCSKWFVVLEPVTGKISETTSKEIYLQGDLIMNDKLIT